ncbi:hypothetical protein BJX65DRAFT_24474 [Aspergillus insuetus]
MVSWLFLVVLSQPVVGLTELLLDSFRLDRLRTDYGDRKFISAARNHCADQKKRLWWLNDVSTLCLLILKRWVTGSAVKGQMGEIREVQG